MYTSKGTSFHYVQTLAMLFTEVVVTGPVCVLKPNSKMLSLCYRITD